MDRKTIDEFERAAEAAYADMYDAKPHNVKDCYDDAQLCFAHAIEAAKRAGLADEVVRLRSRVEHIASVYNSQFRGVGR
jgi:hypothetical protein